MNRRPGSSTTPIAFALVTVALGGCASPRPATQVVVRVTAEPGVRSEMDSLVVRVRGAAIGAELMERSLTTYPLGGVGEIPDPVVLVIAPAGGDAMRLFEAEAEALDRVGGTVGIARLRGAFQPGRTLELTLVLEDRCRGVSCPDSETCRQGRCVPAGVDPGMDGGVGDGGTSDGGVVPIGGECRRDHECDDGVFCNGAESCVAELCASGTRPTCDDGIACTDDQCVSTGCVSRPDATLCTAGPGGVCDPATGGCQYGVCDATTCATTGCEEARCVGTVCMRSNLCGGGEMCCAGACVRAGCDDGNACTTDLCDPMAGCVTEPVRGATTCSDGNACTVGDACRDDRCVGGTAVACDDMNACTVDSCDPIAGCTSAPVAPGTSCADADACDGAEMCVSGVCAPGTPLDCDDRIPCTVDSCAASGGCAHVPTDSLCTASAGGACDAASGCQYPTCTAATCVAGPCQTATCMGSTCVVASTCTGGTVCCNGMCAPAGCTDGNPCTVDSCVAGTGCRNTPQAGAPCEDGDPCTAGDSCSAVGACVSGPGCLDGNPCTDDVCMGGTCSFPANSNICKDGLGCTVGDVCVAGACQPGRPMACDDFNECTADSCSAGVCNHDPLTGIDCGDWTACIRFVCEMGVCRGHPIPGCCETC